MSFDWRRDPAPRIMFTSLSSISRSHTLRCDARQAEERFRRLEAYLNSIETWELGGVLPDPFIKGSQPRYAEDPDATGTPVINTLAIQNLTIDVGACRIAVEVDLGPGDVRQPREGDLLLTMDGGVSIGKPAVFNLDGAYAVDSHVAILRPVGIDTSMLSYLLASPLGQVQFQRAESGASGQTAVTEDDVRRFRFPVFTRRSAKAALREVERVREEARRLRAEAADREGIGWAAFVSALYSSS